MHIVHYLLAKEETKMAFRVNCIDGAACGCGKERGLGAGIGAVVVIILLLIAMGIVLYIIRH